MKDEDLITIYRGMMKYGTCLVEFWIDPKGNSEIIRVINNPYKNENLPIEYVKRLPQKAE